MLLIHPLYVGPMIKQSYYRLPVDIRIVKIPTACAHTARSLQRTALPSLRPNSLKQFQSTPKATQGYKERTHSVWDLQKHLLSTPIISTRR